MSETRPRRLLILSCSDRKNDVAPDSPQQLFSFMTTRRARSLAAWEIYAGVAFQVVKRCQREGAFPPDVDIRILSAKYGLITPEREITHYDLKMTRELAGRQQAVNVRLLCELLRRQAYREIFLMMGRTYLQALEPMDEWRGGVKIIHEPADIGVMLGKLKAWLRA
ncbi:MAG TPA: hypothetical protein VJ715_17705 [Pyrinomonadaceae bacterium]|nr:hypothetical protein [Pyrinomonadaceae bacterium]